jgi:hypothetical protein
MRSCVIARVYPVVGGAKPKIPKGAGVAVSLGLTWGGVVSDFAHGGGLAKAIARDSPVPITFPAFASRLPMGFFAFAIDSSSSRP